MLMHWNYERPINHELQRLRRVVIADQLAARGWDRNGARFDYVVDTKLRKVRYLTHCRFDAGIDPRLLKKAHADFYARMERRRLKDERIQQRTSRHG